MNALGVILVSLGLVTRINVTAQEANLNDLDTANFRLAEDSSIPDNNSNPKSWNLRGSYRDNSPTPLNNKYIPPIRPGTGKTIGLNENTSYTFVPSRENEPPIIKRVNGRNVRYVRSGTHQFWTRRVLPSKLSLQRTQHPTLPVSKYAVKTKKPHMMYEYDKDLLTSDGKVFYRRVSGNITRYTQKPSTVTHIKHYSSGGNDQSNSLKHKVATLSKSLVLLFNKLTGLRRGFKTYQRVLANSFKRRDRTIKGILETLNRLVRSNNKRKYYVTKMNGSKPNWSGLTEIDSSSVLGHKLISNSNAKIPSGENKQSI
ncbi:hypothetical protein K7432_002723 [Basidiobolus ranarum]|uniref:Uncharacterized protein n=1 Tax=Basidiobolus ranarum TaxID=34480 RepID=A0ABR2W7N2_9FUNG